MEYSNFFVQNVALAILTNAIANCVGERYGHHRVVFGLAVAGAVGLAGGWAYSRPGLSPWIALAVAILAWIGIAVAVRRVWPLRRAAPEIWIRRASMQVDPNTHAGRAAVITLGATHSMRQLEIGDLDVGLIPLAGATSMWLSASEGDSLILQGNTLTVRPTHLRQKHFDDIAKDVAANHLVQVVLARNGHTIVRADGIGYEAKR